MLVNSIDYNPEVTNLYEICIGLVEFFFSIPTYKHHLVVFCVEDVSCDDGETSELNSKPLYTNPKMHSNVKQNLILCWIKSYSRTEINLKTFKTINYLSARI